MSWDIITRVTGCTRADVLAAGAGANAPAPYDLQTALFFTRPKYQVKKAVVKIELIIADGTVTSSTSLPLLEALELHEHSDCILSLLGCGAKPLHARLRLHCDARELLAPGARGIMGRRASLLAMEPTSPRRGSGASDAMETMAKVRERHEMIQIMESPPTFQPQKPSFLRSFFCCAPERTSEQVVQGAP